jgi:hypothetical protein
MVPASVITSMIAAFAGKVVEKTCVQWAHELFDYDNRVDIVISGHFAGERRQGTHIIYYRDHDNNILSFMIPLR